LQLFKEHLGLLKDVDYDIVTPLCFPPPFGEGQQHRIRDFFKSNKSSNDDELLQDPLSDEFYNYWKNIAHENTKLYKEVFKCVPDDSSKL